MAFDLNRAANVATIVAACAVVATAAWVVPKASQRGTRASVPPDSVFVSDWKRYLEGGHTRGPEGAPVTILVFGDYECPFCGRFEEDAARILAAFPSQVNIVYRHWALPHHRFAYPAARAAECAAEQGRFWELHDLIYSTRDSLGLISFAELAERAGIPDATAFGSCNKRSEPVAVIDAGARDARAVGGTGTPTIIVNGYLFRRGVDSTYIANLLAATANP